MNIIQKRREQREEIINRIAKGLKNSIKKYGKEGLPFNFESVLITVQANFYCTRRTAKEYVNIAFYKTGLTRSNLPFNNKGYLMSFGIPESKNKGDKWNI